MNKLNKKTLYEVVALVTIILIAVIMLTRNNAPAAPTATEPAAAAPPFSTEFDQAGLDAVENRDSNLPVIVPDDGKTNPFTF